MRTAICLFAAAASLGAADLFRDDFSKLPARIFNEPIKQLTNAIQEYHYLEHRGVPLGVWANAICHWDGWTGGDEDGKTYVEQHEVNTLARIMNPLLITGDPEWSDYTLEVKVRPLLLTDMAGIAFRYHTNRHYYLFALTGGRRAVLRVRLPFEKKLRVAEWRDLAQAEFHYDVKRWYTLKVENDGPRIRAYVDGKLLMEASDGEILKGKIGVTSNIPARFTDVRVSVSEAADKAIRQRIAAREAEQKRLRDENPRMRLWKKFETPRFGAGRNVRFGDLDGDGRPVILYITSANFAPGPPGEPRWWTVARFTPQGWQFTEVAPANHNYSTGSLYLEEGVWRIIGPTGRGPQPAGSGGEVAVWASKDQGKTWRKERDVTSGSLRNHNYVRRPVNAHADFYAFWADGDPDRFSPSYLYFTNRAGSSVWRLPYDMAGESARPVAVKTAGLGDERTVSSRILVYTRNYVSEGKGYVHDNIQSSVGAIRKMGAEKGFGVDSSDEPAVFTLENLKRYRAVVFSNSNNEAFASDAQREAFRSYIRGGGAVVGIHSATGSERKWPYFWSVMGGKFLRHPKLQKFTVRVADRGHPSTRSLPATFEWEDECYYHDNFAPGLRVLLVTDPSKLDDPKLAEYPGDRYGAEMPLAWYKHFDGGRQFYTALGHKKEHYSDPILYQHILGGILWAMGIEK